MSADEIWSVTLAQKTMTRASTSTANGSDSLFRDSRSVWKDAIGDPTASVAGEQSYKVTQQERVCIDQLGVREERISFKSHESLTKR
jgi:hypothetical protein